MPEPVLAATAGDECEGENPPVEDREPLSESEKRLFHLASDASVLAPG